MRGLTYSFVDKGRIKDIYEREKIFPYYFLDNVSLVRPAKKSYPNVCTFSEKVGGHQKTDLHKHKSILNIVI